MSALSVCQVLLSDSQTGSLCLPCLSVKSRFLTVRQAGYVCPVCLSILTIWQSDRLAMSALSVCQVSLCDCQTGWLCLPCLSVCRSWHGWVNLVSLCLISCESVLLLHLPVCQSDWLTPNTELVELCAVASTVPGQSLLSHHCRQLIFDGKHFLHSEIWYMVFCQSLDLDISIFFSSFSYS